MAPIFSYIRAYRRLIAIVMLFKLLFTVLIGIERQVYAVRGISLRQGDDAQPEFIGQRCSLSYYVKFSYRGDYGF